MNKLQLLLLAAAGFGLAACGGNPKAFQSSADAPRVSYTYQDGGDYDHVKELADDYCDEEFNRRAVLLSRDTQGDSYEATFSCQ